MKRDAAQRYGIAGAVSLATFLLYLPALRNGFVWDDNEYILQNLQIRSLDLQFFDWAFFRFHAANWHPLTWISHAVDYALWGLNPLGHHLVNNVLHAVNTLLVFFLTAGLIGLSRQRNPDCPSLRSETTLPVSAIAAFLFGIHPLHVESAAWVSERKDLLCAFFVLLSMLSYIRYLSRSSDNGEQRNAPSFWRSGPYLSALGFFLLALLSKPMAVSVPLILLILDWYPSNRITRTTAFRVLLEKIPFIALSLLSSVVTVLAQQSKSAMAPVDWLPLSARIISAARAIMLYLARMIAPFDLSPFYPFPRLQEISILRPQYYIPALVLSGLVLAAVLAAKKHKMWLAALGYFSITLLPVLGIVQVGNQAMADRYTYLPSIGPFLVLAVGTGRLWEKAGGQKSHRLLRGAMVLAACVIAVLLSLVSLKQIAVWKDDATLWSTVIRDEPVRVPTAYINLGAAYLRQKQYGRAIENFDRAILLNPNYYESYYDRGLAFAAQGLLDRAEEDFEQALARNPLFDPAYNNRGVAYFLQGRYDKALADFNKAIELNNRNVEAYVNRAFVHLRTGRTELAIPDLETSCSLGSPAGCGTLQQVRGK